MNAFKKGMKGIFATSPKMLGVPAVGLVPKEMPNKKFMSRTSSKPKPKNLKSVSDSIDPNLVDGYIDPNFVKIVK